MKKIMALLLSLIMLISIFSGVFTYTANAAVAVGKGDFDKDGEITVSDALLTLRIMAKLHSFRNPIPVGDIDGDSAITVSDALEILRVAVGLMPKFVSETAVTFDNVRTYGRNYSDSATVCANWPNSGIEVRFKGESLTLTIECSRRFSANDNPFIQVWVDGERTDRIKISYGTADYTVAKELSYDEHTVKVLMVTETSNYPLSFNKLSIGTSKGATYLFDPVYNPDDLKFDVYGDSITAGMGNIAGIESDGKDHHDSSGTYAFHTISHYGGDGNYIAHSGWGCYQGWGPDMNAIIPRIWNRACELSSTVWDFSQRQADIVIVALGTNDAWFWTAEMPHKLFIDAYCNFLGELRKVYPEAQFYCLHGMMDETFDKVVEEAARQFSLNDGVGAVYVDMPNMEEKPEYIGSAGHPSYAHGEYASQFLIKAIEDNYFKRWGSKLKMAQIKLERKDTEGVYSDIIELAKATVIDHNATGRNPKLLCQEIEAILANLS